MIATDETGPVARPSRGLLQRFWIVSACIGLCCTILAAPMLSNQWHAFTHARFALRHLAAFEAGLHALTRISAERAPTNGSVGADIDDAARWRTRLAEARTTSDQALARFRATLAASGLSAGDPMILRVEQTEVDLARARVSIDALIARPRAERTDEATGRATDGMIALMAPLMGINLQLGAKIDRQYPALSDAVSMATSGALLRDYAGQLGSRVVVALLNGRGIGAASAREMDRLTGRIEHLRQAIEARLANTADDEEPADLYRALDQHYFQGALGLVDNVRQAEAADPGGSGVSARTFAKRYGPEMAAITAIRDRMLARAAARAEADRRTALLWFGVGVAMVAAIFALLAATARVVHGDVVRPLIATTRQINDLAAERFHETLPPPRRRFDEIEDMRRAITVLRRMSIQRRRLEQEREGLLQSVRHLAETDHLTGLPNRRTFDILASDALAQGRDVALILCDIDLFKAINDQHGHPAGDCVLRAVAERLRSGLRDTDTVFRYGGEEFAVLVPGGDGALARVQADRLRGSVADTPVVAQNAVLTVTLSAGVAWMAGGEGGVDLADLVARADRALYRAKRDGRNRTRSEAPAAAGGSEAPIRPRLPEAARA